MFKIQKLRHYTPVEIGFLLLFSVLLFLAAVQIRFQSSEKILNALNRRSLKPSKRKTSPPRILSLERIVRLVEAADRHKKDAPSCVRRSLVLAWLFKGLGLDSEVQVRIAVRRPEGQSLEAHTWLEYRGMPLESDPPAFFKILARADSL